jgi:hypothetical protein
MVGDTGVWAWAISQEAAPLRAAVTPGMGPGPLARLRSQWSAEQIAVVAELMHARAKARAKFPDSADRLAADRTGVEMASSARAAAHKAARFLRILGRGARITDACCGIGGDAMALADAGLAVTAIDSDERRAWMAGVNAACPWHAADIRETAPDTPGLHIDPARRSGDQRTRQTEDFEPPLPDLLALLERAQAGALKVHPGIHADALPPGELEIISESGRLTQAVLWTGRAAEVERRATLLDADGSTHTLSGTPDRPTDTAPIGAWVHTFDPTVERADLAAQLIEITGLALVHPGAGLLTGEAACRSPWVRAYRVVESMPWNFKGVRARLRELGAGEVTVKTRAGLVEPDRLARELRGKAGRPLVLFALRLGDKPVAIIAEPARGNAPPDGACPSGGASGVPAGPAERAWRGGERGTDEVTGSRS